MEREREKHIEKTPGRSAINNLGQREVGFSGWNFYSLVVLIASWILSCHKGDSRYPNLGWDFRTNKVLAWGWQSPVMSDLLGPLIASMWIEGSSFSRPAAHVRAHCCFIDERRGRKSLFGRFHSQVDLNIIIASLWRTGKALGVEDQPCI